MFLVTLFTFFPTIAIYCKILARGGWPNRLDIILMLISFITAWCLWLPATFIGWANASYPGGYMLLGGISGHAQVQRYPPAVALTPCRPSTLTPSRPHHRTPGPLPRPLTPSHPLLVLTLTRTDYAQALINPYLFGVRWRDSIQQLGGAELSANAAMKTKVADEAAAPGEMTPALHVAATPASPTPSLPPSPPTSEREVRTPPDVRVAWDEA